VCNELLCTQIRTARWRHNKALCHYELLRGLLAPQRNATGYRRYSLSDLQRLEQILALKSLGLRLGHISQVAGTPNI
jgi:MerR family transcriptional regulator, thiopeptide resistance regulator